METPEPPAPTDTELEDQEITQAELASQGFEVEEDQLTPQETNSQNHPTPDHPTGRIGP